MKERDWRKLVFAVIFPTGFLFRLAESRILQPKAISSLIKFIMGLAVV